MTDLKKGTIAMAASYIWWGFMPFYWNVLSHVSSLEIIAYRISFSFATVFLILVVTKNLKLFNIVKDKKKILLIAGGALMLAINWSVFIYAISVGNYAEASMGYYINPIVSIFLGMIFLREKLTKWQIAAFTLVSIGVIYYIFSQGKVPFIALTLAVTFGLYGLYKKTTKMSSVQSIAIETGLLFPLSLIVLAVIQARGGIVFTTVDIKSDIFIVLAGAATLIPLILFAEGAKRIPLTRVGFLQYIAPSLMLLSGFILGEKFNINQLICFIFIWAGLVVYTVSNLRKRRI